MKIIQVNKFYYPRGGADKYFIEISKKLKAAGHEVRVFSMNHPDNLITNDQKYFVSNISFDKKGLKNVYQSSARILYSREAKKKFTKLIQDFQPDIIHLHNIYHQLSPSIISVAKKNKIPVIMHLHDYKLICPNYKLFNKGEVCEKCRGGKYYNCALNKCLKDSLIKSSLATLEMYLHHQILKSYEQGVDLFIAPSQFMKKICVKFNWPKNKIKFLPNFFVNEFENYNYSEQDYLLYFGRLVEEKGVEILIKALVNTKFKLKIAGQGPAEKTLKQLTRSLGLEQQIEFLGFQQRKELSKLIAESRAIIIPSIWYENMPLNLLEALAKGKIVIASNIGGIPEIVKDRVNGFLFLPGDSNDLRNKIINLDHIEIKKIKLAAQEAVANLDIEKHYQKLLKIYHEVLNK